MAELHFFKAVAQHTMCNNALAVAFAQQLSLRQQKSKYLELYFYLRQNLQAALYILAAANTVAGIETSSENSVVLGW